ncbi:hypothetical protein D3C87_899490 [compost metagenome]
MRQGDACAIIRIQHQIADLFRRISLVLSILTGDIVYFNPLIDLRYSFATNCNLNQVSDIRNIQSILCNFVAVNDDLQLWEWRLLVNGQVNSAFHSFKGGHEVFGDTPGFFQIIPKKFDNEFAMCSRDFIHDTIDHRL